MLTQNALATVYPLADQLDASNVILQPVAGTPLDAIVKASRATSDMAFKSETGDVVIDTFSIAAAANAKSDQFEESQHDCVMGDVVRASAATVQRNVSMARLTVAPMVSQLAEMVTMRLDTAEPSALARLEIRTGESNEVLHNPILGELLEKFELMPANNPAVATSLPRLPLAEILPLLETGIASLDKDVMEWTTGLDSYDVENTWRTFFCSQTPWGAESGNVAPDSLYPAATTAPFSGLLDGTPAAPLLVFLWSRHLIENDQVLDGTEMALSKYKSTLQAYVEQAGMWLCRQVDKVRIATTNGILVTGVNGSRINVNTVVYDAWLANGGDNDILYGMVVSNKPAYTTAVINENAEFYRNTWTNYMAIVTATDSNQRFSFLREQFVLVFENMLVDEQNDGAPLDPRLIVDLKRRFKDLLGEMASTELSDVYAASLKLVCRTRFPTTAAEFILSKMDEVAKANPKLSVREAGTVAVTTYICEWVASQLQPASA